MKCERCGQDFPASELRVDRKGNRLLCEACYNLVKTGMLVPEKTKAEAKKPLAEKKLALSTKERLEKLGQRKQRYECTNCGYKFTSVKNYRGKCPYCGEDTVIPYVEDVPVKEIDEMV
ncbi:hypothetical protein B6U80_00250 [Candidatus Pacearchaeota archaeon ex4484_26]|nr:MAG: hypothetical protein B6U80_00250 [Candidatus Pacearchaeota archaeon ex4484_26]